MAKGRLFTRCYFDDASLPTHEGGDLERIMKARKKYFTSSCNIEQGFATLDESSDNR